MIPPTVFLKLESISINNISSNPFLSSFDLLVLLNDCSDLALATKVEVLGLV